MEALGNKVIILPDKGKLNEHGEEVSEAGIVTRTANQVTDYRDQTTTGVVVGFGPAAWLDDALGGKPWVEIGDHVVYAKYSGKEFKDEDGTEYVCVNDDALQVRI